ncbi:hypothetical protein [Nioella ostreopsis]|uniref:hypothetical protein n=1 Tax=Nioella ostreopsis TaxID=2448479 RepID=UPI001981E870|nr:hypothetical protein [Nioella ostreopsis]
MKPSRLLMATALCLSAGTGAVWAQDIEAQIISQLQAQGYARIHVTRTWLGRVRIEAEGPGREREIIFNPTTGEILRDYWEIEDDHSGGDGVLPSSVSDSSGDDGDDRDDHDDDEDNSGSSDDGDEDADEDNSGSSGGDDGDDDNGDDDDNDDNGGSGGGGDDDDDDDDD